VHGTNQLQDAIQPAQWTIKVECGRLDECSSDNESGSDYNVAGRGVCAADDADEADGADDGCSDMPGIVSGHRLVATTSRSCVHNNVIEGVELRTLCG